MLQNTLLKASFLIDVCSQILKGCENHCRKLASLGATALHEPGLSQIAAYSAQMQSHQRDIKRLLEQSKGTGNLVCLTQLSLSHHAEPVITLKLSRVIDLRRDEALQETNRAMQERSEGLQRLVSEIRQENATLSSLAREGHRDSKALQALEFIVVLYVPASLMAVCSSASDISPFGHK